MVTAIESIDEMPDYAVYIIVVEMFKREPKYGLTNWYQGLKFFRTKIYRYFHTHTKNIVISVTSLVRFNFRVLTSFSPRSKIALKFNHTQTTVWLSKWTKFQRKKKRRKITKVCVVQQNYRTFELVNGIVPTIAEHVLMKKSFYICLEFVDFLISKIPMLLSRLAELFFLFKK